MAAEIRAVTCHICRISKHEYEFRTSACVFESFLSVLQHRVRTPCSKVISLRICLAPNFLLSKANADGDARLVSSDF